MRLFPYKVLQAVSKRRHLVPKKVVGKSSCFRKREKKTLFDYLFMYSFPGNSDKSYFLGFLGKCVLFPCFKGEIPKRTSFPPESLGCLPVPKTWRRLLKHINPHAFFQKDLHCAFSEENKEYCWYMRIHLCVHILKAQSLKDSFAAFKWKETFELCASSLIRDDVHLAQLVTARDC